MITALALERFHLRHSSYPAGLQELDSEMLATPPTDFMDGKPLRYRRTDNGHFVLYSVGLDCIDNGAVMPRPRQRGMPYEGVADFGLPQKADLVWPRPASAAEAEQLLKAQQKAEEKRIGRSEEAEAAAQWRRTARRQA